MKVTVKIVRSNISPANKTEDRRVLKIRVTHNRQARIFSGNATIKITAEEFANHRLAVYKKAEEEILPALNIANDVVKQLGNGFTFEAFSRLYRCRLNGVYRKGEFPISFVLGEYLRSSSKAHKTVKIYNAAVNWLLKYKKDMTIDQIDVKFVNKFEAFLRQKNKNMSENTVKLYFRHIKAIYNFAVEQKYIEDKHPFKGKSLSSTRKKNHGLSADIVKKIMAYSSYNTLAQFARDFFVLSFEFNGHYFSDILRFRNKNVVNGEDGLEVHFVRHKTKKAGNDVPILLTNCAKDILNKYGKINPQRPNDYILPYLNNAFTEAQEVDRICTINAKINEGLKIIAADLGIARFTISQARHSYASIRIAGGANLTDVQTELGHSSYETTRGYVNTLNRDAMKQSKAIKDSLHTA